MGKQSYSGSEPNALERQSKEFGSNASDESQSARVVAPPRNRPVSARRVAKRLALGTTLLTCLGILPSFSSASPDTTIAFSQQPIQVATVPLGAPFENAEAVQEVVSHRVRSGETLWQLSRKYGVDVDAIASANNLNRGTKLKAGQVLYILRTQSQVHVVSRGETLNSIARRYGVSVGAIMQATPGIRPTDMKIGQRLTIPSARVRSIPAAPQIAARPPARIAAPPPLATVRRVAPAQAAPAPIQGAAVKAPSVSPELAAKTLPYQAKSGDSIEA